MADWDIVRQWIILADMDLRTAEHIAATMIPLPLEIICFHCQQAVEKYLKGFLELHNEIPPHIHDLVELQKRCEQYNAEFVKLQESSQALAAYSVRPRYDLGLDLQESDMRSSLRHMQSVKTFIQAAAPELFQEDDPSSVKQDGEKPAGEMAAAKLWAAPLFDGSK
ncbi:MAG: HEPN domain-containing protein [Bacteroidales bacterium]|jgi:HEPN domain-containing protein|nr:HEPN domain-containing protein [Bacteroidales bacterium]